jgi:hypothetical protein
MIDIASDLKQRFCWVMDVCLERYKVLPDGKSFLRSDEDERAIDVLENLLRSVDAIPPSSIRTAEYLRDTWPEDFERWLAHGAWSIRVGYRPTDATEFLKALNHTVEREKACA